MSYTINTTNGTTLLTILDGTTDSSTGLTLIGRNYTGYGGFINDNFIRLMENFADTLPPQFTPITGTLWYDTGNQVIKAYDGANFYPVSGRIAAASAPTVKNVGDQWWDTVNYQLNTWTGSEWYLVGPTFALGQAKSGTFADTVTDNVGNTHVVVGTYVNGTLISATSVDPTFTLAPATTGPYSVFATMTPGINLIGANVVTGNATNSSQLGGVSYSNYARLDVASTFAAGAIVNQNLVLGNALVTFGGSGLVLQNNKLGSNLSFYTNTTTSTPNYTYGNILSLSVDGATGLAYVAGDPINPTGISTKRYVDTQVAGIESNVAAQLTTVNNDVSMVQADYLANIALVQTQFTTSIATAETQLTANLTSAVAAITANAAALQTQLNNDNVTFANISATIATLAPINNPTFTGTPAITTTPAQGDNSTSIADTAYVDTGLTTVTNEIVIVAEALAALQSNVGGLAGVTNTINSSYAPINSPTFTGTPAAPTPTTGDVSTNIATTAFVSTAVATLAANVRNISYGTTAPSNSQGNDGDIYFQILT